MLAASMNAPGQPPGIITYQGRVTSNGSSFTGLGQFKFALVQSSLPGATLWSQDGQKLPDTVISVPVTNGLFMVTLGDTSIPGMMNRIPAEVFDTPNVSLRIWFNDGASGFEQLSPDLRLTSVGYALRADNVADGAITGAKIANGVIGPFQLGDGAVTTPKLANGAVTTVKIAADSITGQKVVANSLTSDDIADTLRLQDLVVESAAGQDRVQVTESANAGALYMAHSSIGRFLTASGTTQGGFLRLFDADGGVGAGQTTAELGSSPSGGYLSLFQDNKTVGVSLQGQSGATPGGTILLSREAGLGLALRGSSGAGEGSLLTMYNGLGETTLTLDGDASGRGGAAALYNGSGSLTALVDGNSGGAGLIEVRSATGGVRARLDGSSTNTSGEISVFDDNGTETIELLGASSAVSGGQLIMRGNGGTTTVKLNAEKLANQGAELTLYNGSGDSTLILNADNVDNSGSMLLGTGPGRYGLFLDGGADGEGFGRIQVRNGVTNSSTRVQIDGEGDGNGGQIAVYDASGTRTIKLAGAQTSNSGGRLELSQANGTNTVILDGEVGNGGGGYLQLRNGSGVGTITLDSDFSGEGRITTQVLQITGGSDLSEQFEVRSTQEPPEPGMIVSIDPLNPGELAVTTRPYDRTVAGVLSGAGGVKPGMLMGQAGSRADGRHPVALTGRVYCRVDANLGAIEPGDLITTSATPGHGMKVADHPRAQGAIIGKAMTGLATGRGLVLVLVALQ